MAGEKESPLYPLRSFELRLLRCSLSPDDVHFPQSEQPSNKKSSIHLHALIHELLQLIESGDYVRALSSDAARTVFSFSSSEVSFRDSTDYANQFYSEMVLKCVESFLLGGSADDDYQKSYRAFLVMAISVAAFLAFTQCNFTGPLEKLPPVPLMELGLNKKGCDGDWVEWEVFARKEFMLTGSDLLGKFSNLQYIVFAKILLMRLRDQFSEESEFYLDGIKSISWWLARLFLFQQKILDEHSSYLFNLLQVFMHESLQHFGTVEKVKSYWGAKFQEEEAKTIVSMLHLEMGIVDYTYGRVDSSGLHFKSAEEVSGLHLSVSGALGFRTVHQIEPKAQLVLVANTRSSTDGGNAPSSLKLQRDTSTMDRNDLSQNGLETCEASDVLMIPRFLNVNNDSESSSEKIENGTVADGLKAVQQALILAQCLTIEKSSRQDKLQGWDMAPYIEAIDSQQSTYFIIRRFCDILRIRWESSRSHTKERALLMMEKLVQGVYEKSPSVTDRIYCCYGVHIPSIAVLRKEYGDILVSCGLIGEAVKIYEDLELWDNLIYCYCLLEKKAAAVELIKKRLAERPSDPRLWCSLGDVTNNDACYEKALEVSENRSARAKRSLARSAYNRGEYEMSKILWESAMALNSLYPDGWFALGAAALKDRDVEKALIGFTRAVQLDPENGEAWNNIACLHMIKKQSRESFIAFKEALKFKRNSWQMWENFSHVAADIGNFGQAIEALQKVLDLTNNKKFDAGLLERMILENEQRASASCHFQSSVGTNQNSTDHINADSDVNCVAESTPSHVDLARTPETDHLLELLGKILTKIVGSTGGGPETLGLLARWHKLKGNLEMCSEALQKQLRSLQGSDLWRDGERFKKFAHASLELSKVYMELASRTSTTKDGLYLLGKAEMHLKSTIRQAESFSEYKEFRDLQDCYDLVQTKLQEVLVRAE